LISFGIIHYYPTFATASKAWRKSRKQQKDAAEKTLKKSKSDFGK